MKHVMAGAALLLGLSLGLALPRWNAAPAFAQEHTHAADATPSATPMQMSSAQPMPMGSGMPMPMASEHPMPMGTGMMQMMMPPMKSAADRGYMGAMMQMHGGMMRSTMTGNADHDFLAMMIPHHQAAVAMAQTELQYGRDAKVRALARRIISAQQAEINQMQSWLR